MRPTLYGTKSYVKEVNARENWVEHKVKENDKKQKVINKVFENYEPSSEYLEHLKKLVKSNCNIRYVDIDLILNKARIK